MARSSGGKSPRTTIPNKNSRAERSPDGDTPPMPAAVLQSQASPTPPALPFRVFKLAVERLKLAGDLPHRIDRTAWSSKHFHTMGARIAPAFRFLRLTDSEDRPCEALAVLTAVSGTESWSEQLGLVLSTAYADILVIGVEKATPSDLLRMFRSQYGLDPISGRIGVSFFVQAMREAQLSVGPFLSAATRQASHQAEVSKTAPSKAQMTSREFGRTMLLRLPPFDETWSEDVKLAWLNAFNELVAMQKQ